MVYGYDCLLKGFYWRWQLVGAVLAGFIVPSTAGTVCRSAMNWRVLLFLCVTTGLLWPMAPAWSQEGSGDDSLTCSDDGSSGAASGAPQLPDLLRQYQRISPCQVAGVNYPVGYGDARLRDPIECACLPSGASIEFCPSLHPSDECAERHSLRFRFFSSRRLSGVLRWIA